jgi:hypothetical protein
MTDNDADRTSDPTSNGHDRSSGVRSRRRAPLRATPEPTTVFDLTDDAGDEPGGGEAHPTAEELALAPVLDPTTEIRTEVGEPDSSALLSCRGIDMAYGPV